MSPLDVQQQLVDALRLDLVGPGDGLGAADEVLPQAPSSWYLTGFLVPIDADAGQRAEETNDDAIDEIGDSSA